MGFLTKTPTKSVNYFKIFPVNNNLMSIDVNCSKKSLTQSKLNYLCKETDF